MIDITSPHECELSEQENEIFNTEFNTFISQHYPKRTHPGLNKDTVLFAVRVAKSVLGVDFDGSFPECGRFGWTPLISLFTKYDPENEISVSGASAVSSLKGVILLTGFYIDYNKNIDVIKNVNNGFIKLIVSGRTYPSLYVIDALEENKVYFIPKTVITHSAITVKGMSKKEKEHDKSELYIKPIGIYFSRELWKL